MQYRSNFIKLLIFSAIIMFCGLTVRELFSGDETRVAGIIAQMSLDHDYVTPKLNGRPFLEYPPLYYQVGSICFDLFGFCDAAAKLPSALSAFAAGLLVFLLAKQLKFLPDTALCAGVILLTSAQFFNNGRKCMVDMMLSFFILLSIYAFYTMLKQKKWYWSAGFFLLYAAGLTGGFFTKGLIGIAFPWAGLGTWLVAQDVLIEKKFSFKRYCLLGCGMLPVLPVVLYWARELYLSGGRKALDTVFIVNGIGRFSGSQGDHVEPFWYYLEKLPGMFQPWLLIFLVAFAFAVYRLRKKQLTSELLLLCCCSLSPVLMLHAASAKRQVYMLPVYAFWALLAAEFIVEQRGVYLEYLRKIKLPVKRIVFVVLLFAAALLFAAGIFFAQPEARMIPVAGLLALAAGAAVRKYRKVMLLSALALLFASVDTVIMASKNPAESLRPMYKQCEILLYSGKQLTLGRAGGEGSAPERTSGGAVFYLLRALPEVSLNEPLKKNEVRIVRERGRKGENAFADSHFLLENGAEKRNFSKNR